MNWRLMLWTLLLVPEIFAGITFEKNNSEPSQKPSPLENTVKDVARAVPAGDLSGINARLRVEGAAFRAFNLYFPPTKNPAALTAANKKSATDIRQIIERDLAIVGGFNFVTHSESLLKTDDDALMKQKGAEGLSKLSLSFSGNSIKASLEHKNLITGKKSFKTFEGTIESTRRLSHLLAQSIYEEFIGPEDLFLLQVAAIKRDGGGSQVVMLDFDGHNEQSITSGSWRKTSPYFSPDGKSILYTVVSSRGQGIVEQEVGSKRIQFRLKKDGLNLDPRIMPDNSGMLATLSFENNANIYRASRTGSIIGKVTDGLGLNLSPSISTDGKELAFVSDRSGTPQIYVQALSADNQTKKLATRLTFQGKYNQTPHWSPDGKLITFTGRDENKIFDIFLVERTSGRVSRITENQGRNQEPFFTPSGRFVIFTSEREGKPKPDIFIATLNGDHQYRLTNANADQKTLGYFSPVVRPKQKL